MKAAPPDPESADDRDPILEQPERVAEIAIRAFARGVAAAIAENDRLGVPSYGCDERGRITVRHPPKPAP